MGKKRQFLKEFFKERKEVGALSPSSRYLAKKMIAPINFAKAKCVVELGPGTGIFTELLLKNMEADSKLLVFETNKSFYENLKESITDERVILINDSAEFIGDYLEEAGFEKADYIVSSLPLTVIPVRIKLRILNNAIKYLSDQGKYIQFQYSLNAHKLLKNKFREVKLDFTPMNIPPAFVYRCKK